MPLEVKNVLISDPLDNSAIEILSKANINVQVNTGLKPDQLINEIKVGSCDNPTGWRADSTIFFD